MWVVGRKEGCVGESESKGEAVGWELLSLGGGHSVSNSTNPNPLSPCSRTLRVKSAAEAVVRLNSLYTTWEELCAKQVGVFVCVRTWGGGVDGI